MSVQAPPQTERQFERAVVEYAQLRGWLTHHHFDSRRSSPGWPDLAFARRGRLVLAELKTEKGRISREQRVWLEELGWENEDLRRFEVATRGRRYPRLMVCVWRPSMWSDIEEILV